jgi:hypothetical protein
MESAFDSGHAGSLSGKPSAGEKAKEYGDERPYGGPYAYALCRSCGSANGDPEQAQDKHDAQGKKGTPENCRPGQAAERQSSKSALCDCAFFSHNESPIFLSKFLDGRIEDDERTLPRS